MPQDHVVNDEWLKRHDIEIPRAAGIFESGTAWVKVDTRGTIISAGEKDQTVLAHLVENKTLSSADVDYAIAYVTCRSADRAYRKQKGFKSSLDLTILGGGTGLSCEEAAEVFSYMRAELGHADCAIVEFACDTLLISMPANHNPQYRRAFTALAKAFDNAVKKVRDEKPTHA